MLRQRDDDGRPVLELRVNGVFVMDTAETSSERALAAAVLGAHPAPRRVLIGGLGLGFTLREVLDDARVEQVTVVEIEAALVGWMRDGTVPHGPAYLADERGRVVEADLAVAVAEAAGAAYDLVLLDVDNGPGYLVHDHNAALYAGAFLSTLRDLVEPGGAIAVWSAARSPDLLAELERSVGPTEERPIPVWLNAREEEYVLYLAWVPSQA